MQPGKCFKGRASPGPLETKGVSTEAHAAGPRAGIRTDKEIIRSDRLDSAKEPRYSSNHIDRARVRTMFGIGFQEMLIILVVVLIFFGPKRLPDLAKSLGKGIAEFKKASEDIRKGIDEAVKEGETAALEKLITIRTVLHRAQLPQKKLVEQIRSLRDKLLEKVTGGK